MRYVLKPSHLKVIAQPGQNEKVPFSFEDFLDQVVWQDLRWKQDGAWVDAAIRLTDAIAAAAEGTYVEVSDAEPDDFGKLVQVLKAPASQIRPDLTRLTLRFVQAVLRASATKPEPKVT